MAVTIAGFVKNGVVVPDAPLPEGAKVEIHLNETPADFAPQALADSSRPTLSELRRMPREQRQAVLASAAELAEHDYRCDKNLSGFDAFIEEELDDNDSYAS